MNKNSVFVIILAVGILSLAYTYEKPVSQAWNEQSSLREVLLALGDDPAGHALEKIDPAIPEKGRQLFMKGRTTGPNGKRSRLISRYFVCTQCHNYTREDPDLRKSDPEARLTYAVENDLPFLQGTTMYGTVNKVSWYNGDYDKKYGELVEPARKSLREAIQLCAKVCAQGRYLEKWEEDYLLAYFWTLEYKLGDLDLGSDGLNKLNRESNVADKKAGLATWLKSLYLNASPATFGDAPFDRKAGFEMKGNPDTGAQIYERSCISCHSHEDGVSYFYLDESPLTHRFMYNHVDKYSKWSIYQVIKYGTYPLPGSRPYMPHYPLERMSNQQVEDLRAYLARRSGAS